MTILVMTRLPREGKNKTRLIPALGPKGAMEFHDRLARHAISRASAYCLTEKTAKLRVLIEGGTPIEGKSWLGDESLDCREQPSGDLGERMLAAAKKAHEDGAEKILIIGTDCPSIDQSVFEKAAQLLDHNDLIYGPALDGGYYLVGMRKIIPEIFQNIEWGSETVLATSLEQARKAGTEPALLPELSDVDHPEDLSMARATLEKGASLSVIIPTLNEAQNIEKLLEIVSLESPLEIIITDGGSTDQTQEIAEKYGAITIQTAQGRAAQMNAAARIAKGELLLFLHADTLPPENFSSIISQELQRPNTSAGAFKFRLSGDIPTAAIIEILVHLRCKLLQTPYGDQGLFIRSSIFHKIKGFPEIAIMEDLEIVKKLKKLGTIRISEKTALTSPRRWQKSGLIRTFLSHQLIIAAHFLKIPTAKIIKLRAKIT